jgi:hypothetical protein
MIWWSTFVYCAFLLSVSTELRQLAANPHTTRTNSGKLRECITRIYCLVHYHNYDRHYSIHALFCSFRHKANASRLVYYLWYLRTYSQCRLEVGRHIIIIIPGWKSTPGWRGWWNLLKGEIVRDAFIVWTGYTMYRIVDKSAILTEEITSLMKLRDGNERERFRVKWDLKVD